VDLDEALADLPEGKWLARRTGEPMIAHAADVETVYHAVRSGVGRALLPLAVARRDATLIALRPAEPTPTRELWLLVDRQVRQIRRVSLTLGWVEAVVRDAFGSGE
jgi:DNA-binding transcriptional LysR family regulator